MLDRDLLSAPRVRLALFALGVSALLLVFAIVRAVRIEPTELEASVLTAKSGKQVQAARVVQIDPEQVVQQDIFAYDRTAPAGRYPMPGDLVDEPAPVASGPPPARPQVLGTAVGIDGSAFATAQLPNMSPRIVRVGDKLGIYTVVAITRGTVTFRAADALTFEINAP
jgi:hypothetical protein